MDPSTTRRAFRTGLSCLFLFFTTLAAAQELQPIAIQTSLAPAGGQHKLFVTLGNRTNLGMDNIKVTVATGKGDMQFGAVTTLNPYQWQTLSGTVDGDEGVVVVEYVFNDKAQKLAVPIDAGSSGGGRGMPPLLWLGGAALLGAFVTLAGAAVGRRGR